MVPRVQILMIVLISAAFAIAGDDDQDPRDAELKALRALVATQARQIAKFNQKLRPLRAEIKRLEGQIAELTAANAGLVAEIERLKSVLPPAPGSPQADNAVPITVDHRGSLSVKLTALRSERLGDELDISTSVQNTGTKPIHQIKLQLVALDRLGNPIWDRIYYPVGRPVRQPNPAYRPITSSRFLTRVPSPTITVITGPPLEPNHIRTWHVQLHDLPAAAVGGIRIVVDPDGKPTTQPAAADAKGEA